MKKAILLLTILFASAISIIAIQSPATEAQTPTQITIYANEFKFGLSASSMTSPGPTLTLTSGDTVTVTLMNVGAVGHGWALTDQPQTDANRLFSATIGSGSNPIAAGGQGSVTFTVGAPGTYYYICPVPGHVSLGMWGTVQVVSAGATPTPTTSTTASPTPTPTTNPTATATSNPSTTASASPSTSSSASATPSKSPSPSPTIPELSIFALIGILSVTVATVVICKKRLHIPGN